MRIVLYLLFLLSLSGCAGTGLIATNNNNIFSPIAPTSWQAHQYQIGQQKTWQIKGRVSIVGNGKTLQASFNWQQLVTNYQIHLFGLFGIGNVYVMGYPAANQVMVSTPYMATRSYSGLPPEDILQQHLGSRLPVTNLGYWIRGLPNKNKPFHSKVDQNFNLIYLKQDDWQVYFSDYKITRKGSFPGFIKLIHPNWQLKIALQQWIFKD